MNDFRIVFKTIDTLKRFSVNIEHTIVVLFTMEVKIFKQKYAIMKRFQS